jgi:hypothetical protein
MSLGIKKSKSIFMTQFDNTFSPPKQRLMFFLERHVG